MKRFAVIPCEVTTRECWGTTGPGESLTIAMHLSGLVARNTSHEVCCTFFQSDMLNLLPLVKTSLVHLTAIVQSVVPFRCWRSRCGDSRSTASRPKRC